jgi:hypothetical protein
MTDKSSQEALAEVIGTNRSRQHPLTSAKLWSLDPPFAPLSCVVENPYQYR